MAVVLVSCGIDKPKGNEKGDAATAVPVPSGYGGKAFLPDPGPEPEACPGIAYGGGPGAGPLLLTFRPEKWEAGDYHISMSYSEGKVCAVRFTVIPNNAENPIEIISPASQERVLIGSQERIGFYSPEASCLGSNGGANHRIEVSLPNPPEAQITIQKNGQVLYSQNHLFEYTIHDGQYGSGACMQKWTYTVPHGEDIVIPQADPTKAICTQDVGISGLHLSFLPEKLPEGNYAISVTQGESKLCAIDVAVAPDGKKTSSSAGAHSDVGCVVSSNPSNAHVTIQKNGKEIYAKDHQFVYADSGAGCFGDYLYAFADIVFRTDP